MVDEEAKQAALSEAWPALTLEEWSETYTTLHMWTQVIGKIRLARAPMVNHWWQVVLYVTSRGLTTSPIPDGHRTFQIDFDFIDHRLIIETSTGDKTELPLTSRSVAEFYADVMAALRALGIDVRIWTRPVEIEHPIPFEQDRQHATYNQEHVGRIFTVLVQADRVLQQSRSGFVGKCSPVHFFWGAFDLAFTRFSGRRAPLHPGGVPNVADWVGHEAYSRECASCGFWPGGGSQEAAFYAYAYPEPAGFNEFSIRPQQAYYSNELREFILPYREVRTAADPDKMLLDFFQSTYEAAAERGGWNREDLEVAYPPPGEPITFDAPGPSA